MYIWVQRSIIMKTLTIKVNERSKAGKEFLVIAETFKSANGVEITGLPQTVSKSYPKNLTLLQQIEIGLAEVKELKDNNLKRKTLTELLNEK